MARRSKFPERVYLAIHTGSDGADYFEATRAVEDIDVDRGTRIKVGVYELRGELTVRNQTTVEGKPLGDKGVPRGTQEKA